jgi:hypothetical protein
VVLQQSLLAAAIATREESTTRQAGIGIAYPKIIHSDIGNGELIRKVITSHTGPIGIYRREIARKYIVKSR